MFYLLFINNLLLIFDFYYQGKLKWNQYEWRGFSIRSSIMSDNCTIFTCTIKNKF